ncbi:MAG TPA: hypothetical protein VD962_05710 [Rubricoccaceae bacterium]|nr:hypothetical protein [Rubricoccaceae bacterium]
MRLALLSFACGFVLAACASPEPTTVQLVPAESLQALLPAALDSFQVAADTVYRGYFGEGDSAVAVVTASRTYGPGTGVVSLNLSSTDATARYAALSGAPEVPDTLVAADSTLRRAANAGWTVYQVGGGVMLLHPQGRAAEVRALLPPFMFQGLRHLDLDGLLAARPIATEIDSTFARTVE